MEKDSIKSRFDFLKKLSEDGHYVGDVQREVEANLDTFIRHGIQLNSIMELLGHIGVFENYDTLQAAGATIDLVELAKNLGQEFVWLHLEEFVHWHKVDVNQLLDEVFDADFFCELPELTYSMDECTNRLLSLQADPLRVFKLFEPWLEMQVQYQSYLFNRLGAFVERGLDPDFAKEWLVKHPALALND